MIDLDALFPPAPPSDVHPVVRRTLRGPGVSVSFTGTPPLVEFDEVFAYSDGLPTIDVATVTRHANGKHAVVVRDIPLTAVKAAEQAHTLITTGSTGYLDRGRTEHDDGSTVTILQLAVPVVEAQGYVLWAASADKADRPAACRECGQGHVRKYHAFAGGWVHNRCVTRSTDVNTCARQRLAETPAVVEHFHRLIVAANERGDYAAVHRHSESAAYFGSEKYLRFQVENAVGMARKNTNLARRRAALIGA